MSNIDNSTPADDQQWFTPADAAKYLRVTRQTIYRYMTEELLPYYELKSGGGRRMRRADLDALLEAHREEPANHPDET